MNGSGTHPGPAVPGGQKDRAFEVGAEELLEAEGMGDKSLLFCSNWLRYTKTDIEKSRFNITSMPSIITAMRIYFAVSCFFNLFFFI